MHDRNPSELTSQDLGKWLGEIRAHIRSIAILIESPKLRDGSVSAPKWARVRTAFLALHEAADECDAALFAAGLERLR